MSARDDLVRYLAGRLPGNFVLPETTARLIVDCLPFVIDDHDDVETTTLSAKEREVIRHKWIVVKVPNGVERHTMPFDDAPAEQDGDDR